MFFSIFVNLTYRSQSKKFYTFYQNTILVFSVWCCVFWPAFGCCAHPKTGWINFFQPFSTFFVHFKTFSVISRLKSLIKKFMNYQIKVSKKRKNTFIFTSFLVISSVKSLKKVKMKVPESWSKYTTFVKRILVRTSFEISVRCL